MAAAGTGAWESGGNLDTIAGAVLKHQDGIVLLPMGAVAMNSNSADQTNINRRGIKLYINCGQFGAGAGGITVTIQGKDPYSGQYFNILTSAPLTGSTSPTANAFQPVLSVYPGLNFQANVSIDDVLPATWRAIWQATAWGVGDSPFSISCCLLV